MNPFIAITIAAIFAGLVANIFRFHVKNVTNKFILITLSLLLVKTYSLLFHSTNITWMIFVVILLAAFSLQLKGAIVFSFICWLVVSINSEINLLLLLSYLIFASFIGIIADFYASREKESQRWFSTLMKQSKQLDVFREVSLSMQQTLQLDKLLQIILISVTAGHGLGFNRAMIFLKSPDKNQLNGSMGIGPMNANEGFVTWERLAESNLKLLDLIQLNYNKDVIDPELNALIKSISIDLDNDNVFEKALLEGVPCNVQSIDENDIAQKTLFNYFQMQAFAIIPLLNQGNQIGVLIIDNIVNNHAITDDDIDSVIPLANQAAIAIEQANLYAQIETMALNDNLTGLLNQRSFETYSTKYFVDANESLEPLSIIIFDIDSFKHYNDTNGHLLGNQVLTQLSKIVKDSVREQDLAFRFGGEEFVVILPNTTEEKAVLVGERIRTNIELAIFPNEETQPKGTLTVSVGVASTEHAEFENISELIEAADNALYLAKGSGKNVVMLFKEDKSYV